MINFQEIQNRNNTKSVKWDEASNIFLTDDILPMWIADMDFKAPDAVNEAIKQRAEHGIYGYTFIDNAAKQTVQQWVKEKHDWPIDTDSLIFSPGVITSLHTAIQTFTAPNDKIMVQTPVYTPFFNLIKKGKRQIVENELQLNSDKYEIDFEDFEAKLQQEVKALVLCSPHNPVGRVWRKEELEKIAELCLAHNVLIISDEIHADIVFPEYRHIPIASLSGEIAQQTITCMSPTKTFNLAGLQASYIVVPNKEMRTQIEDQMSLQGFNHLNTIGTIAMEQAYLHGKAWLQEVMNVFAENKQIARNRLIEETNGKLNVIDSEATYLLWIDCSKLPFDDKALKGFMIEKAKVGLNAGSAYGTAGEHFMRINIACPRETLEEGINRIVNAVNQLP